MSVVVVEALRTPVVRACPSTGPFRASRSDFLSGHIISALCQRLPAGHSGPDAVVWGCARQHAQQGYNIARQALLEGGLSPDIPAFSVNRNCASGLDAIILAASRINGGYDHAICAGGVEHMDHLPMGVHDAGPEYQRIYGKESLCMIRCAEHLAEQYKIDRTRQDAYAHRSHGRAIAALDRGDFRSETVSTRGLDPQGQPIQVVADLTARRDSNLDRLSTLAPILSGNKSTVTAGNCSQVNVAAAGVTLMRETTAIELGLRPLARLLASADVGVPPIQMGLGPVPAIRLALKRAGISISDIDQWEINEAFAAQVLSVIDLLGLDEECVNPRGGAISLGHPLGATGARLVVSLCHAMARGEVQRGVVALCVGGGQGVAAVFERV